MKLLDHTTALDAILLPIEKMGGRDSAKQQLKSIADHFGLRHATYLSVDATATIDEGIYFTTTYNDEWVERYLEKNYQEIDPVVHLTRDRLLPLDWSSVEPSSKLARDFFGEATEFGVGRQGLSIPIRGPNRDAALFSITADFDDEEWHQTRRILLPYLQITGYEFHKSIVEMETRALSLNPPALSLREIECLKWASEGKTVWETAKILGISDRTIAFHIMGAITRLGCVNKTHAVAKAVRLKLI